MRAMRNYARLAGAYSLIGINLVTEKSHVLFLHEGIHQANTRRWPNADLMLAQRRRRWASIKLALGQRLVFAGAYV